MQLMCLKIKTDLLFLCPIALADPRVLFGGRSSAKGASIEALQVPRGAWVWVSPWVWGAEFFLDFLPQTGAFCVNSDT